MTRPIDKWHCADCGREFTGRDKRHISPIEEWVCDDCHAERRAESDDPEEVDSW